MGDPRRIFIWVIRRRINISFLSVSTIYTPDTVTQLFKKTESLKPLLIVTRAWGTKLLRLFWHNLVILRLGFLPVRFGSLGVL